MDDLDYRIISRLDLNSRDSYAKIAADLNVTKKTAERRIAGLMKNGMIRSFEVLFNKSELDLSEAVCYIRLGSGVKAAGIQNELLKINGVTEVMVFGGGNALIFVILNGEKDLANILAKIGNTEGIADLDYEVVAPRSKSGKLTKEDWLLIRELNHNARKDLIEIANSISRSSKTVQRRLRRLLNEGIIRFGVQLDISKATGLLPYLIVAKIRPGVDKNKLYLNVQREVPAIWRMMADSNPLLLSLMSYAEKLGDLNRDIEKITGIEGISAVNVLFNVSDEINNDWLDEEIEVKIHNLMH